MNRLAKTLTGFVILFHVLVFVVEAFLWMHPEVHGTALPRLTVGSSLDPYEQALVLKGLFVNQGFYNLFLALAGIAGFRLLARGRTAAGYALIQYMCLFALGAGIVLAVSTTAYIGAFLQSVPAGLALAMLLRSGPLAASATLGEGMRRAE